MLKPKTIEGYDPAVTDLCERVLVTVLRDLGPWKDSMYLVGGLVPRYLVSGKPAPTRAHAGTGDIDVAIKLEMLAQTEAYKTLEENLKKIGFTQRLNENKNIDKWGWCLKEGKTVIELELLAEDPGVKGVKVRPLPTERGISALNIPHISMVFDEHDSRKIAVQLIGDGGMATETIRHANLVCFLCLKAFAYDHRRLGKDVHDILYCLEFAPGGVDAASGKFVSALHGKHGTTVKSALRILRDRFHTDKYSKGFEKDGPVAVAKFELGEDGDKDARILRQRNAAALIERLLKKIDG